MDIAATASDGALKGFAERTNHLIWSTAHEMPDHPAIADGMVTWTYRDLSAIVDEVADLLTARDVRPGDRVMIVSANSLAMVALLLATTSIGAWVVPVSPGMSNRDIDQIRDHSNARRVFYDSANSAEAKNHAVRHGAVVAPFGPAGLMHEGPLNTRTRPAAVHADGSRQVAMLMYTPMLARDPKSVMLTHRDLQFNARIFGQSRRLEPSDRIYAVLPLSHVVGLSNALIAGLMFGCTVRIVPRDDPALLVDAIASDSVSVLYSVQDTFRKLLEHKALVGLEALPRGRLRHIEVAGLQLDTTLKRNIEAEFGLQLVSGNDAAEGAENLMTVYRSEPPNSGMQDEWPPERIQLPRTIARPLLSPGTKAPSTSMASCGDSFCGGRLRAHLARLRPGGHDAMTDSLELEALYLAAIRDACLSPAQRYAPPELSPYRGVHLIREAIEARYDEVLSLDELSELAGLGKFQLMRQFKRFYGLSPHAYLNLVRVQRCRDRILRGDPLADAAVAVGFADQAHMTRIFRSTVGYTPGALAQIWLDAARRLPGRPSKREGRSLGRQQSGGDPGARLTHWTTHAVELKGKPRGHTLAKCSGSQ